MRWLEDYEDIPEGELVEQKFNKAGDLIDWEIRRHGAFLHKYTRSYRRIGKDKWVDHGPYWDFQRLKEKLEGRTIRLVEKIASKEYPDQEIAVRIWLEGNLDFIDILKESEYGDVFEMEVNGVEVV